LLLASSVVKSVIALTLLKMLLFKKTLILWLPTILVDIISLLIRVKAFAFMVGTMTLAWKMWMEGLILRLSNYDLKT
ncbi:hypothetical protein B0J13DRAFT_574840, partial [Dactylonectria estremocensis]